MADVAQVPHPIDGVEHHFVQLPGLRMHVAEAGRGDPVLLLHGFPQHWWEWREVIPELSAHYRVICPDLRGAGWTDAPPDGYTRDQLLADVVNLLDALELDRVHLIAHDWGALLGFQLCLQHPDRVRSFLSLAVPHPYMRFNRRMIPSLLNTWYQLPIVAPGIGPRALSDGNQWLPRTLLRTAAAKPKVSSDSDVEYFLAPLRDRAQGRAGSQLYRHFIQPQAKAIMTGAYRNQRLATPTHLLVGAADPLVKEHFLGGFEEYADDLTTETVDRAGHWIPEERPDVVIQRALELSAGNKS